MNILYIATSFPEPDKGDTIYTDLAETLHNKGYNITVAVSEQKSNRKHTALCNERGFQVLRIVVGDYYNVGFIKKGLTTIMLPFFMKWGISSFLKNKKFDFILFETPPITNATVVRWAKKKFFCRAYLMLKDIFPQNAIDIGILKKKSIIFKYFKRKENQLYKTSDIIGCMSQANLDYIANKNPSLSSKLEIFPNAKKITYDYIKTENTEREKLSIPEDSCVFLFGGNMGKPQYIELLCRALIHFKNDSSIYFLCIGRGTDRYMLENVVDMHKILNACIIDNLPRRQYEEITKECDVGLILLDPRFTIPNFPSRILSYMEYAKPIIAATDLTTDIDVIIKESGCGIWVHSALDDDFFSAIKQMQQNSEKEKMGFFGREYLEKNFNIDNIIEILIKHFDKTDNIML